MRKIVYGILVLMFVSVFSPKAYCGFLDNLKSSASQVVNDVATQATSVQRSKQNNSNAAVNNLAATNDSAKQEEINKLKVQKDAELAPFWAKEQPILNQKISQGKILKIKDLYVGMNIDDACKVLNEKLGVQYGVIPPSELEQIGISGQYIIFATDNVFTQTTPIIIADDQKRVISIQLLPSIVDKLYNTAGLPGEEFAQNFVNNYKIVRMDPFFTEDNVQGWKFISPEGYKLSVTVNKIILIEKIATKADMKFD